jgi:pantoate--beta-alanine ligase
VLLKSSLDIQKSIGKGQPKMLGLVPTMGALHDGHLSLISKAKSECDITVVSIFVNPTQFNNPKDLSNYPRNLEQDVEAIKQLGRDILIYAPDVDDIYPNGPQTENFDFGIISKYMEGQYRQGHFQGVGTVLKKLFELVKPHRAYFGEKDYQQLAIVKKLVQITNQPVDIIGCETYREPNGLAKSSRNKLLSNDEKSEASIIFKCLNLAKTHFKENSISEIKKKVKSIFNHKENFKLEYFEIADEEDLIPTQDFIETKKYRAFIAAYCNEVRLIDNMPLN